MKSLPAAGPLDERAVHLSFDESAPRDAKLLAGTAGNDATAASFDGTGIERDRRRQVGERVDNASHATVW